MIDRKFRFASMASALKSLKLTPRLKELRIHLCQKSDASKGVRYGHLISMFSFCIAEVYNIF